MFHKVYHRRHITLLVHIPEIYSRSFRSEVFCEKGVLKNFTNFWEKNLCSNIFFDKVPALRPGTYLKKGLLHRGFPVSLKQIFRTASFIEQLYWLLLFFWYLQISEETNKRCSTKKFLSVCSYMSCTVWLNGWVFVYELSGYCFKSGCSHLKKFFSKSLEMTEECMCTYFSKIVWYRQKTEAVAQSCSEEKRDPGTRCFLLNFPVAPSGKKAIAANSFLEHILVEHQSAVIP